MATKQPSKLAEVAKNPAAYVLILVAGLIGAILRGDGKDGTRASDCKEQLNTCQTDLRAERRDKDALLKELLISKGTLKEVGAIADTVIQPLKK